MYTQEKKFKKLYSGDLRLNKLHINWHLTDWCNYNCFYCIQDVNHHYSDKPKETQSDVEDTARIIRDKIKNQNISFSILGGEVSFYDFDKINDILFKDNNCSGFVNLTTNLSAPLYQYIKYLHLELPDLKFGISASYQWRDLQSFVRKSNILKTIADNYMVTCVVTDKHSLEDLQNVYKNFMDIPFKFIHGRLPKSDNKMYELSEEVIDYIEKINSNIEKKAMTVEYNNGDIKVFKSRADVLREFNSNFKNMICFTGVVISPDRKVYEGSCLPRETILRGDIDKVDVKPCKGKCKSDKGCSLCNSFFIWNGEY